MQKSILMNGTSDKLLVLAHGAGAPCDHPHMQAIADALLAEGIGTFRFNFPFMEAGRRRVDNLEVSLDAIHRAIEQARSLQPEKKMYLGGHSFGGRMATHYLAEKPQDDIQGLVLFSFPLHPAKKPDTKRATHLPQVSAPMLFLSGTRDALAEKDLLDGELEKLSNATRHWLETADHSFKILKRTRTSSEDVYSEAARVAKTWLET